MLKLIRYLGVPITSMPVPMIVLRVPMIVHSAMFSRYMYYLNKNFKFLNYMNF